MTITEQARALCDSHQDGPTGCPTCRALETRLQPVSEALRAESDRLRPLADLLGEMTADYALWRYRCHFGAAGHIDITYELRPAELDEATRDALLSFAARLVEPRMTLGPVNKIVTLMRGQRRIKSVLARVPVGAAVRLVRDEGTPLIRYWSPTWQEVDREPFRAPGWRAEIDERTVLAVTDAEIAPPRTPPPPVPLWRRMRQALREQVLADADWIAKRLGYHRDGECEVDW